MSAVTYAYPLYWLMTPLGAVWVDRRYSAVKQGWYYSFYTGKGTRIYYGVMDDFGNLVETL